MRPAILLFLLLSAATAQARLDETVQQIEARYGKPLKGVVPENPATVAGLYEKNGFRITVGFYQNKVCYEKLQKVDPKNPNSFVEISETERDSLLQVNCNGCSWKGHAQETFSPDGRSYYVTTYKTANGPVSAIYDGDKKVFTVRSLVVEQQNSQIEKREQQENLKGF